LEDDLIASAQTRGKQDNLTFFAFTATPKAKTLEMFGQKIVDAAGQERFVPFHLYSMRQAIEEGFILDVLANYTTYKTYYRLANRLSADDPVLPKGKAASALARYVSLHPTNLAQKAEIIVEHFRAHTAGKIGGRAKAMVVTRSRLHAVKYWQAITKYVADKGYDLGVLVAFSGSVIDPDLPNVEYREGMLNGFGEAALPKKFAGDEFQVLIVAEKYQTGFDQPLLHTMYVDKRLDGIKAVQTLSRLNRTYPGKEDTFVLDFANELDDIREAFRPYYAETAAAPDRPERALHVGARIRDAGVLDDEDVDRGVRGHPGRRHQRLRGELNAAITPAKLTGGRPWTRTTKSCSAPRCGTSRARTRSSSQIAQFTDAELEGLYFYGKYLQRA
jgi:type I restriction enzyme R subunit